MLQPSRAPDAEAFNRPRESIRKYFPTRKCFVFDRPGDRDQIQELDKIPLDQLQKTFVADTEKFLQYMHDIKPNGFLLSKPFTGEMFASIVKTYVNALREGGVPNVDDAMTVVANIENERLKNRLIQNFKDGLNKVALPQLNTEGYQRMYHTYQTKVLSDFRKDAMLNAEKIEINIVDEMDKIWREKKEINLKLVKKHCSDELNTIYKQKVGGDLAVYHKSGGYSEYLVKLESFKSACKEKMKDTDKLTVDEVLHTFLMNECNNGNIILAKDKDISDSERKAEIDRIQQENKTNLDNQKKEFDVKMKDENTKREVHLNQLAEERQKTEKAIEKRQEDLIKQWELQREMYDRQIEREREGKQMLNSQIKVFQEQNILLQQSIMEQQLKLQQYLEKRSRFLPDWCPLS